MSTITKREKDCRQLLSILKRSGDYKALPGLDRPSPHNFAKYQDLAAHLLACEMQTLGAHGGWLAAAAACSFALRINAPLLHLSRELGEAFLATAAPSTEALDPPLPAFILNLPYGLLRSDQGEVVLAIVVAKAPDLMKWLRGKVTEKKVLGCSDGLSAVALLSTGELEWINLTRSELVEVANRNLESLEHLFPDGYTGRQWGYGPSEIPSELARLTVNAILCLQHRPELQTDEPAETRQRGFGKASSYRGSIRWLGRDYRRRCSSSGSSTGTGTGKAPHWRRGHWHRVVHGAGRAMRRLKWFQPVYVNGTLDREVAR